MPWFVGDPDRRVLGVREDKSEAGGVLKEPNIFRKGFKFRNVLLSVDSLRVDEIDRQPLRITVLAVTG